MKRKFSFGLPPLKIPSRAETRALKEALAGNVSFETTPISPPLSPFINRRPLDSRTEAQLQAACAAIVKGSSGEDSQAALNFKPLHQMNTAAKSNPAPAPAKLRSQSTSQLRSNAPVQTANPGKNTYNPDIRPKEVAPSSRSAQDLVQANVSRKREQAHASLGSCDVRAYPPRTDSFSPHHQIAPHPLSMSPPERPKTAPGDSSEVSYSTPKTASTDHFNRTSTAITSAVLTPSRPSNRGSKSFVLDNDSYQAAIQEADVEAAVWMKQELDKRRQQAQEAQAPQPPPSRSSAKGWSLRSEIREYVRPRTSSGARSASRDSHSRKDSDSVRSPSAQGWRSWSLRRKSSKGSLAESAHPDVPSVHSEERSREHGKKEINLNRELPPLPSLDTWQESQQSKSQPKADVNGGMHIASLMRSRSRSRGRKSVAESRKSTATTAAQHFDPSESMPQLQTASLVSIPKIERVGGNDHPKPEVREIRRISAYSKASSADSCFSPASSNSIGPHHSLDLNRAADRMKSIESFQQSTTSLGHQRKLSDTATISTRPMTRDGKPPNFSRKISIDNHGRIHDPRFPNVVEITALPPMPPKKQNFAGLRRVLSKIDISKKNHPQPATWMDRFEADGIKSGVMLQNETASAPVIRY